MEVVHHTDRGALFPPLRHLFDVLFYYTLLLSLAKGTTTLTSLILVDKAINRDSLNIGKIIFNFQ